MDNGALQRDQAARFKSVVNKTTARKGRRQQSLSGLPLLTGDLSPSDGLYVPRATMPEVTAAWHPTTAPYSPTEYHRQSNGVNLSRATDQAWSTWQSSDIPASAFPLGLDMENYSVIPENLQNGRLGGSLTPSPGSSGGLLVHSGDLTVVAEGSDLGVENSIRKVNPFPEYNNPYPDAYHTRGDGAAHHHHSCPQGTSIRDSVASPGQLWSLRGHTEDALLMHFLDQVFYVQYPFYQSRTAEGRGWLFSILRKVKAVYHGALALSERHLLETYPRTNEFATSLAQLRAPNSHHDIALRGLQVLVSESAATTGFENFISSLDVLVSLLQLMFFEVCVTHSPR